MKRKIKKKLIRFFLISFLFLFNFLILTLILNSNFFKFTSITINSVDQKLNLEIKEYLNFSSEKYFFIFNKNNFLLTFDYFLKKDLRTNFIVIDNLEINQKNNELAINLEKRKANSLFCHLKKCFLLDEGGLIFEEVIKEENNLPLITYHCKNCNFKIGDNPFKFVNYQKIINIINYFSKIQNQEIEEIAVFIDNGIFTFENDLELIKDTNDIQIIFENGSILIFTINRSDEELIENFNLLKVNNIFEKEILKEVLILDLKRQDRFFFKERIEKIE